MRPERRAGRPSFLARKQDSLTQAYLIDRVADSRERIQPPLATLAFVEEVPDGFFDQLIGALVAAARKFLLDLLPQIGR
jgi:hypothetical protein